jgi:pimeloyl-ACP methyl ester carboxylesterase
MISHITNVPNQLGVHSPDEEVLPDTFDSLKSLATLICDIRDHSPQKLPQAETKNVLEDAVRILEANGIQRQTVTLETGETIHSLQVEGDGPTWVLLPGLGNPSSSWGAMLQSLEGENRAAAVDFTGFGLSTTSKERPTHHDHIANTLAFLETLPAPFVLVGNSAGAMVATEIARRKPEWVKALVITGFGLIEETDAWWTRLMALSDEPEQFLSAAYYRAPELTLTLRKLIENVLARPAYQSFLEDGGFEAMKTTFDNLTVPTLFVGGQEDEIIPPTAVSAAAERVPNSQVEWLARVGHFSPAEQPEELQYVIRNFLKKIQ